MNTLIFILIVGLLLAVALLLKSSLGQGLVDDAQQWWKLRSIQGAAALALLPQFVGDWITFIGSVWPQAQEIFMQVMPGTTQNALTVAGALFALWRLGKQKQLERPRWPPPTDDVDAAGA